VGQNAGGLGFGLGGGRHPGPRSEKKKTGGGPFPEGAGGFKSGRPTQEGEGAEGRGRELKKPEVRRGKKEKKTEGPTAGRGANKFSGPAGGRAFIGRFHGKKKNQVGGWHSGTWRGGLVGENWLTPDTHEARRGNNSLRHRRGGSGLFSRKGGQRAIGRVRAPHTPVGRRGKGMGREGLEVLDAGGRILKLAVSAWRERGGGPAVVRAIPRVSLREAGPRTFSAKGAGSAIMGARFQRSVFTFSCSENGPRAKNGICTAVRGENLRAGHQGTTAERAH